MLRSPSRSSSLPIPSEITSSAQLMLRSVKTKSKRSFFRSLLELQTGFALYSVAEHLFDHGARLFYLGEGD